MLVFYLFKTKSNPSGGTMWIGFYSPYLTLWVFPETILWGSPPTSKTEMSSLSSHCLDAEKAFDKFYHRCIVL